MKNVISDKVLGLQPSGIRKFFDIVSEMDDVISLGVGEPDFDTPWHIRDEGIYSLERGRTFYTSNAGLKELREEICRYLSRRCKVDYTIDETLITVGGSEAIDLAMRVLLNPGDEVLIPQPSFVSYLPCAVLADGVPVVILKVRSILTALFHQFPFHRKLKFAFSICPLRVAVALTHQLCHSLSDLPDLRLAQHRQAIVDRSLIILR